jgi:hypothetical protein
MVIEERDSLLLQIFGQLTLEFHAVGFGHK